MAKPFFKPSYREALATNNLTDRYYAASYGKEPRAQSVLSAKRVIVNHSPADDLEDAVKAEVEEMLRDHPLVAIAWRQNGGGVKTANGGWVNFYNWVKRPLPKKAMKLPDLCCILIDKTFCGIETKRRNWLFNPNDPHEVEQKNCIAALLTAGHRAGFATSRQAAISIIEGS